MKQLVKLHKRPSRDGQRFTFFLRYEGENGKRKWETLGHGDQRKAERQRAQKEKELRMGYIEPDSMRLRDFIEDSLARTGDQIRESTQVVVKVAMNDFIRTIGNIDFRSVTLAHGRMLISMHRLSRSTLRKTPKIYGNGVLRILTTELSP